MRAEEVLLRVLVLDGSRLLPWLLRRLAPTEVKVEIAASFGDALRVLLERPPDAAILNVDPGGPPWREIGRLCSDAVPPIPVLYESNVFRTANEAGVALGPGAGFLPAPTGLSELRDALAHLLERGVRRPAPKVRLVDDSPGH